MRAEFARRCRKRGLAVTPQRLAITWALLGSVEHPRAEAIYLRVRKQHSHISLATVHRTLETLCEIGEARKLTLLLTFRALAPNRGKGVRVGGAGIDGRDCFLGTNHLLSLVPDGLSVLE